MGRLQSKALPDGKGFCRERMGYDIVSLRLKIITGLPKDGRGPRFSIDQKRNFAPSCRMRGLYAVPTCKKLDAGDESAGSRGESSASSGAALVAANGAVFDVIENVERFGAELEGHTLFYGEVLEQRHVDVPVAGIAKEFRPASPRVRPTGLAKALGLAMKGPKPETRDQTPEYSDTG